jgi:hypothetical protein
MNDPPPHRGGSGFEIVAAALLLLLVGPFALAAGGALAVAARSRARLPLYLATVPSTAAGMLLWPFTRDHLQAALVTIHGGSAARPTHAVLAAWPSLWPAWLAATAVAPLVALAILAWQPSRIRTPDLDAGRGVLRRERRIARKARSAAATNRSEGLFLGYALGGDRLLPRRRGRVYLPLERLAHHLLVAGATGSGKTETVLRIADSLARASNWKIVFIDGKGDPQTMNRFAALMEDAGRKVWLFPDESYDGWRGSSTEIAGRLLQLIDFADEGGGTYYRDLAVNTIRLACGAPAGPPRSADALLERLHRNALLSLYPKQSPAVSEIAALEKQQLDGIRARYAAFFTTVAGNLDGATALDEIDTAYFLLDGLRLKHEAGHLARFLVEEFTQWAVARKPREQRVLLIVDEFSAIAEAGQALVDVVERMRSFAVAAILCPQLAEGMGSPEAAARIIGSAQTILLHATATPELLVQAGGTRRVEFTTRQLQGDAYTGLGSIRVEDEYRADPNAVRRLKPGQCFAIGSGLAMKLQVAAPPKRPKAAQSSRSRRAA